MTVQQRCVNMWIFSCDLMLHAKRYMSVTCSVMHHTLSIWVTLMENIPLRYLASKYPFLPCIRPVYERAHANTRAPPKRADDRVVKKFMTALWRGSSPLWEVCVCGGGGRGSVWGKIPNYPSPFFFSSPFPPYLSLSNAYLRRGYQATQIKQRYNQTLQSLGLMRLLPEWQLTSLNWHNSSLRGPLQVAVFWQLIRSPGVALSKHTNLALHGECITHSP